MITADGGIDVTLAFEQKYRDRSLHLLHRGNLVAIESYLDALVPVLDDAANVDKLLIRWAILANRKLGLDYAMVDVGLALEKLNEPLEVLSGGNQLDGTKLIRCRDQAHHYAGVARKEKIESLEGDWSESIVSRWNAPTQVESDLLGSLLAPKDGKLLFAAAKGFV